MLKVLLEKVSRLLNGTQWNNHPFSPTGSFCIRMCYLEGARQYPEDGRKERRAAPRFLVSWNHCMGSWRQPSSQLLFMRLYIPSLLKLFWVESSLTYGLQLSIKRIINYLGAQKFEMEIENFWSFKHEWSWVPVDTGDLGSILVWEEPLEEEMAMHSSIPAWKISWIKESGGLHPKGHKEWDTTERLSTCRYMNRKKGKLQKKLHKGYVWKVSVHVPNKYWRSA